MDPLLLTSAVQLAQAMRRREISPMEVMDAHIDRIHAVNPQINAVVAERFEAARIEARAAEERIMHEAPESLPRFLGVPFTVKELIAVKGMPFTAGVVARRHVIAEEDAPLVHRMRQAGAIPMGVTNVSEAGVWLESHNRIYGRTNNPFDSRHIAGGSSGGEGAIIAAGGSPIGIGADIGGSIRNPSYFNGIVGHKPSGGLLPTTGHWPPAEGKRARFCVSGPMGRRVGDLIAAMEVFSKSNDPYRDPGRPAFRAADSLRPEDVTIYWYTGDGLTGVDPEVEHSTRETVHELANAGFRVEPWRPAGLRRAPEIWTALVSNSADESLRVLLGNGEAIPLLREWRRFFRGRSNHPFYALMMATFDGVAEMGDGRNQRLLERRDTLRDQIESHLGERGVLLCLPYPRPAPRHNVPLRLPFAFAYCGIFNVLEMPATAVPTGFSRDGLPLGVQVVARRHNDPLTLWVAEQIEHIRGGWKPALV